MPLVYSFPFRRYTANGKSVMRPVLRARLRGPLGAVHVKMLVDSGSDCSLLDRGEAQRLGLKLEGRGRGRSVSRRLVVSRSEILLEVGHPAGWLPRVRLPVEIPSRPIGLPFAVLGRDGFFEAFDIAFTMGPNPRRGRFHLALADTPRPRRVRPNPTSRMDRRYRLGG